MSITRWLKDHFPGLRQAISRRWYDYFSALDRGAEVLVMNYGYAPLDGESSAELLPEEEKERYPLEMYHHLASAVSWKGKDALEVSSGRGGGASYIVRRFQPRSFVGLELSRTAVEFCQSYYLLPGLSFRQGDAEQLPFPDDSFDILLNVESSLYYPHFPRFLAEVARVLRAGGHFIYADMRYLEEVQEWREQLKASGLALLREEDLTASVAKALGLDMERRLELIDRHVPGLLKPFFRNFIGQNGPSLARGKPRMGERVYLSFLFQK